MKLIHKILLAIFIIFVLASCETEVHKDYYTNGVLKEEYSMRRGEYVGKYKALYSSGKPQAIGNFLKGQMDGVWQYFYESGRRLSIEEYSDGKLVNFNYWDVEGRQLVIDGTGIVEKHYPSGQIESVMSYRNCVFDGKCETWFPNGIKASEVFYEQGKPVGKWKYWNEYGELIKTENY
jgi:antitoxin component YwqK of YwqJK toxin-antitoxin module